MSLQKIQRFSSIKYLNWVKQQPCVVCGDVGRSDDQIVPHHVKGIGNFSGAGLKAGDHVAMPMHAICHAEWHTHPDYMAQWAWLARTASRALVEIAEGRLVL